MSKLKKIAEASEAKAQGATDVSGPVQNQINWLQKIMFALVMVLFLGFSAMFVAVGQMLYDSFTGKQATYTELEQTVGDQNDKIEELTNELRVLNEQKTLQKTN